MNKNTTKKLTGYPSIDKPWMKYYSDEAIHSKIPECTMYEAIYENNKDHLKDTALNYFGHRITYGELFINIEKAAKAFWNLGVRSGDVVMLCLVNMPETVYTIYALNRLGAVVDLVHPPTLDNTLYKYILDSDVKYMVVVEELYLLLQETIRNAKVEHVVIIPTANSMVPMKKFLYHLKKNPIVLDDNGISWNQFMRTADNTGLSYGGYKKNQCFVLAHTGGTTGIPKVVMLSNENLNSVMHGYQYLGIPFERKQKYFNDLPPFIMYGLVLATHTTLSYGLEVILYPVFDSKGFPKQFIKYRPNHFSGTSDHINNLINNAVINKMNLNFLISAGVGGDTLSEKIEMKADNFLKQHNCQYSVYKGYGMTELAATAVNTTPVANVIGSVGIPLVHNTVKIMKLDSDDEATYGEMGEIWIAGASVMLGYHNNETATAEIIRVDDQGTRWLCTGDLGYINKDGLLFHKGRIRRIYLTTVAKIFPVRIEEVIDTLDEVENCAVVGRHMQNSQYYEAVGFVVLKEKISASKQMIDKLTQTCEKELPFYMIPVDWHFVNELPRTPVGKVDFRRLEDEAEKNNYNK